MPSITGVTIEKCLQPRGQVLDDTGPDCMIEHRRRADLDRAAAKQKVFQRVRELADAADPRELAFRKRLRHLRHFRQRLWQDGWPAKTAARDEAINIDLELEGLWIDQRDRRKRIGRSDGVGTAKERRARFRDDVRR